MFSRIPKFVPAAVLLTLVACSGINDSWEIKGGGYLKYSINGEKSHTIELHKNDVEPPFYVNNSHSYFFMTTRLDESKRGDQLSLMVNKPSTNGKISPVSRASINGRPQVVTWLRVQNSTESPLSGDSSYVHFDEIIKDSLYTANLELYFVDCRSGSCRDSLPPIHLSGRLRYWIPDDER